MDIVQSQSWQTEDTPTSSAYGETRMRVHFHLKDGVETIRDLDGVEVADLEEARVQASRAIEELRQEAPQEAEDWSGWQLEAADGSGRLLFSLDLAD